jgi:hypothetical protein
MLRSPFHWIRSCTVTAAVSALAGLGLPAPLQANDNRAPMVPSDIRVPEGNNVHFHGFAEGVQIYTWNGDSWGTSVPEAVLFDDDGNVVAIHYAGPTWESNSGSKVVGAVVPPRVTVDPAAIPWLLLSAAHTEGPGILAATTYIHRVNTVGGLPPSMAGVFVGQVAGCLTPPIISSTGRPITDSRTSSIEASQLRSEESKPDHRTRPFPIRNEYAYEINSCYILESPPCLLLAHRVLPGKCGRGQAAPAATCHNPRNST